MLTVGIQLIPIIRYKGPIFHRINGYLLVVLLLLSNVGALMIGRHSFGGEFESQVLVGLLAIMATVGAFLAYYPMHGQNMAHLAWRPPTKTSDIKYLLYYSQMLIKTVIIIT